MQKKLQHRLVKKNLFFFFPLFLAVTPAVCFSQTALAPGDLFIVSISSDSSVNFEFVPLVNLEEGTVIYFTDNAYVSDEKSLAQTEGNLAYTAPETIPAGTIVSYDGTEQSFEGSGIEALDSGDNMLVYQASGSDTTYIYGIGWGGDPALWTYNSSAEADTHSDIPSGLSEAAHTAASLGAGQNHWYNSARGMEGSPETLIGLVGNTENWHSGETMPSGYNNTSFKVTPTPVLRFSTHSLSVSESEGVISLSIELVEPGYKAVSADVVFMEGLSTVSRDDIENYSTQTVRFSDSDVAGTKKTVTINIPDKGALGDSKTVTFSLLNNTGGSVAEPQMIEVKIEAEDENRGGDAPNIVITEVNADPGDDADGNGVLDSSDDEFVEFVNNESSDIDISGWTFSDDGSTVRHVFPSGTKIPASGALVLFANEDVSPAGSFGGAVVQNSNQSPTLHLGNQGDVPTLKDADDSVIASYTYGSEANDKQSVSRNSGVDDRFKKHSEVTGYEHLISSPGVRTDGASYGSEHRMDIRGGKGWRMISSPTQNVSFKDLLDGFRIQGINGSDTPAKEATIYYWDEATGGAVVKPANVTDVMEAGKGYMIYFFEDEEAGTTDNPEEIAKTITVDKTKSNSSVSIAVSATDANKNGIIDHNEGYNLLGNPFGTYISVTAVLDALEKVDNSLSRNVLVWNSAYGRGNGTYRILSDGDLIAPFQAFFVRFMDEASGNAILKQTDLQTGRLKAAYKEREENRFGYKIALNDGNYDDTYQLIFREEGDTGSDKLDAYKPFSLNPGSLSLFSNEGTVRLMKNILPTDLNTILEIPLMFEPSEGKKSFEFTWEKIGELPDDWDILLIDQEIDKEINLRNSPGYDFSIVSETKQSPEKNTEPLINQLKTEEKEPRFVLLINPGSGLTSAQDELSESVKLNPNYPNPFNSTTRIPFELAAEAEVQLSIWNIVGQKVATLIDGVKEAGPDEVTWNAADLPSGIYIAQMEVGGNVYIRKMTLIKY